MSQPVKTIKHGKTQVKKTNLDENPDDWSTNSGHRDSFIVFRDIGTSFRDVETSFQDNQDKISGQSGQAEKVHKVKPAKNEGCSTPKTQTQNADSKVMLGFLGFWVF